MSSGVDVTGALAYGNILPHYVCLEGE